MVALAAVLSFAATLVGTSTEAGAILEPHQVAVDKQELRRLHWLTGPLIGNTAPPAGVAPAESVPYSLPTVTSKKKKCLVCHQIFKMNHHLWCHMDIHKGTSYPCTKCHKSLASRKMLRQHKKVCKGDQHHECEGCGKSYVSTQILRPHVKVKHGAEQPEQNEVFQCPHCQKEYTIKKYVGACRGVHSEPRQEGAILLQGGGLPQGSHLFQCQGHMVGKNERNR